MRTASICWEASLGKQEGRSWHCPPERCQQCRILSRERKEAEGVKARTVQLSSSYCAAPSAFLVSRLLWFNYSVLQMVLANRSIDQEH